MLSSKRWASHFKHSRKKNKQSKQNKTKFHPSELLSGKEQHGSRCSWWALSRGEPHCLCCWFGRKFVYFMQISMQHKLIRVWLVMHSRREAFLSVRADEGMWVWLLQGLRNSLHVCFTQTAGILWFNTKQSFPPESAPVSFAVSHWLLFRPDVTKGASLNLYID